MSNFTALAMPCTQEQFEKDLKPTLKRWGFNTSDFSYWDVCNGISNYIDGVDKKIGSFDMSWRTDEQVIPYNPAKFLDSLFPEKWCVRINSHNEQKFKDFLDNGDYTFNRNGCGGRPESERIYVLSDNNLFCEFSIPTDYTEVTLEELVYHYEQPKEEVMKEEHPKWEDKTTKGEVIEEIIEFYGHYVVKIKMFGIPQIYNADGICDFPPCGNLIPFNPRIAELKARKEELGAELEGINKELNR